MWEWSATTFTMFIDGLMLLLQGSIRLLPVVVGFAFLYVLVRWFLKEPGTFIRGWLGFIVALIVFPFGPALIDSYLFPVGKDSWLFLPIGIGCAYMAYKLFVIIAGLKDAHDPPNDTDDGAGT